MDRGDCWRCLITDIPPWVVNLKMPWVPRNDVIELDEAWHTSPKQWQFMVTMTLTSKNLLVPWQHMAAASGSIIESCKSTEHGTNWIPKPKESNLGISTGVKSTMLGCLTCIYMRYVSARTAYGKPKRKGIYNTYPFNSPCWLPRPMKPIWAQYRMSGESILIWSWEV